MSFRGAATVPTASLLRRKFFCLHSCCCQHPLRWSHGLPAPCCGHNTGGLLGGQGRAPELLGKFHSTWSLPQGKTACKPRARRAANAICHIDTELKQEPYYGRGQNVGLPPLLLWSLKHDCGFRLLCPLLLCFLFHTSTQLQWEGVNHPSPPRPSLQPGAFLLQVSKGEFKFREMSGEAGRDHSCLICLNSCCSPLRRSGRMVLLELGGGMRRN